MTDKPDDLDLEKLAETPNFRWLSTGMARNKLTGQRYDLEGDECRALSIDFAQKIPAKDGQLVEIGKAMCSVPSLARLAISQRTQLAKQLAKRDNRIAELEGEVRRLYEVVFDALEFGHDNSNSWSSCRAEFEQTLKALQLRQALQKGKPNE